MFTTATPARVLLKTSELQTKQAFVSRWFQHLGLGTERDSSNLWSNIGDGVLLCQLIQKLGYPPPRSPLLRHDQRLRNLDNIAYFIQALPAFGMPAYQIPVVEDILGFRSNAPDKKAKVIECLHGLYQLHEAGSLPTFSASGSPIRSGTTNNISRRATEPGHRQSSLDKERSRLERLEYTETSALFQTPSPSLFKEEPLSSQDEPLQLVLSQFIAVVLLVVWFLIWTGELSTSR